MVEDNKYNEYAIMTITAELEMLKYHYKNTGNKEVRKQQKECIEKLQSAIKQLSPTPIEPSEDAKKIIVKWITNELMRSENYTYIKIGSPLAKDYQEQKENLADRLLQKLPQPKQFNEAEIRDICIQEFNKYFEKFVPKTLWGLVNFNPLVENIIKALSTPILKDKIKEYYDE